MSGNRLNPSGDYSGDLWTPRRLVEFRVMLGVGRAELAEAAEVSEAKVVAVESGAKPLEEPLRSQVWSVIDRLFCEQAERDVKANPLPTEVILNPLPSRQSTDEDFRAAFQERERVKHGGQNCSSRS